MISGTANLEIAWDSIGHPYDTLHTPIHTEGSECTGGLNTHCTRIKDTEGIRIYPHDLSETIC